MHVQSVSLQPRHHVTDGALREGAPQGLEWEARVCDEFASGDVTIAFEPVKTHGSAGVLG